MTSPYTIKSIAVQIFGRDISIEVKGEFTNCKYSLKHIDIKRLNMGLELNVVTYYDEHQPVIAVAEPFRYVITLKSLNLGVYYVRVDNNNNWIKWFKILGEMVHPIDVDKLLNLKKSNY